MAIPSPISHRATVAAMFTLTAVTGIVDAVTYLAMGHVFVANMTGNVVFLGFSLNPSSGLSPVASITAAAGFLLGAWIGGLAGRHLTGRDAVWLGLSFAAEAILLAAAAVLGGTGVLPYRGTGALPLIAVLAMAFGLQNATVRRLGIADLMTTVLTMTLTGLGADHRFASGAGAKPVRRWGSVLSMLLGAALGAVLVQHTVAGTVAIAAVLVGAVAATMTWGPRPSTVP
ncbi:YoaK family protein [Tsukamurella ocularis]|uniref:YoaK family protein n=1 Tax=Tsukamurella ocularis TaxID=1970234 RepID=UPI0039F09AF9